MDKKNKHRLTKVAKELSVGVNTLIDFFTKQGVENLNPNSKIDEDLYNKALNKFGDEKLIKEKIREQKEREAKMQKVTIVAEETDDNPEEKIITPPETVEETDKTTETTDNLKDTEEKKTEEKPVEEKEEKKEIGPKILGKLDLETFEEKKKSQKKKTEKKKKTKQKETDKKEIEQENKLEKKTEKAPDTEKKQKQLDVENATKDKNEKNIKEKIETKKENKQEQEKIEKIEKTEKIESKKQEKQEKEQKTEKDKEQKEDKTKEQKIESPKQEKQEKEQKTVEYKDSNTEKDEKEIKTEKTEDKKEEQLTNDTPKITGPKVVGKIDLNKINMKTRPDRKSKKEKEAERKKLQKERKEKENARKEKRHKRKRIQKVEINKEGKKIRTNVKSKKKKEVVITNEVDVQKQVKETLKKLEQKKKSQAAKFRREKRKEHQKRQQEAEKQRVAENKLLKLSEFISVKEMADLMNVPPASVVEVCFDLGQPVTINYRLESNLINLIADEFGFEVEYTQSSFEEEIEQILKDKKNQTTPRPPIVTVMGHVDHGKTSLLDYIRQTNIAAKEAGGITQHIGASLIKLEDGSYITFIDTPGHEAFTAMRARGTKVTDIAVIIIAADDSVMPQTEEAIDHARAADIPIIFAINKIDKPGADPQRIRQQLAERNMLVEDWGGKYGCVEISAKKGTGIDELLERIMLEAEMLELKANPDMNAIATVLEAKLDKGRGYITNIIVRTGTLRVGDIVVAGAFHGKVKAMYNEFNKKMKEAGPSIPAQVLGLDGAPEPGEPFVVMDNEREARTKAEQRQQIIREMELRARHKHSLEEISRRFAEGEKIDINFIVKADVKGSVDAIVDQVTKLTNEEVQVNVVRSAVGAISDTDVMLASASQSIIIGFNVRPTLSARKLAEDKDVEIRLYSIIYEIIDDVKAAVSGLLKPEIKEEIIGSAEVLNTFKIPKVGTIAGCIVREGKIKQNSKVRLIRDGVVIYSGKLNSLKRFKDDVKEVQKDYECGMSIENFNDIKVGDFIEAYVENEVERTV